MKTVKLIRSWTDHNQTTGTLMVIDEEKGGQPIFMCPCIERGDRNNQKNISSVPQGVYPLVLEWSPRFETNLWELKEVPNRSECKIHPSNYWDQLNGCIAPGRYLSDMDGDGYMDVTSSGPTTKAFHKAMSGVKVTTIEIINSY